MKYLIIVLLIISFIQDSSSQVEAAFHCQPLDTTRESKYHPDYKNIPCLSDYVKSTLSDSSLMEYVGKKSTDFELKHEYCDESKAIYVNSKMKKIIILKDTILMSDEKLIYEYFTVEGYNNKFVSSVTIEGLPFAGVRFQPFLKGVVEKQTIVSKIKIEWNEKSITIPLKNHFLLFNTNFCHDNEYGWIEPIKIYDIGNDKIAIYFHGEPRYINQNYSDYVAKVIVDKEKGYIGTIVISEHALEAYGWRNMNENFSGF